MSSAYAVGAVKRKFNTPCGHMGTLDPMASGVLPIGIGQTSRLFPFLIEKDKTYVAEFKFGLLTDTLDITGKTEKTTSVIPSKNDIQKVLKNFIGDIDQIPPSYSAKCIDGKRGYELARKGIEFSLKSKTVHIDNIELIDQTSDTDFKLKIDCKGGTYIRSLARDIGYAVGSLATMSSLVRTKSGIFTLDNGVELEEFKNSVNPEKYLIPSENALSFERIVLSNEQATRLLNGLYDEYGYSDGLYEVFNESEFWGVGEVKEKKIKMRAYVR